MNFNNKNTLKNYPKSIDEQFTTQKSDIQLPKDLGASKKDIPKDLGPSKKDIPKDLGPSKKDIPKDLGPSKKDLQTSTFINSNEKVKSKDTFLSDILSPPESTTHQFQTNEVPNEKVKCKDTILSDILTPPTPPPTFFQKEEQKEKKTGTSKVEEKINEKSNAVPIPQKDEKSNESWTNNVIFIVLIVFGILLFLAIIIIIIFYIFSKNDDDEIKLINTTFENEDLDIGSYPASRLNNGGIKIPSQTEAQEVIEKSLINGSKLNITNPEMCNDINITWDEEENKCVCRFPFFGPYCTNEFHDTNYVNFGYVDNFNPPISINRTLDANGPLYYSVEAQNNATALTFSSYNSVDPTSCTSLCTSDPSCMGVSYNLLNNQFRCGFLTTPITIPGDTDVKINLEKNLGLYLNKSRTHPFFLTKVFVYSGRKPPVYWIKREGILRDIALKNINHSNMGVLSHKLHTPPKLEDFIKNKVFSIDWVPERIVNDGKMVGVWSTKQFTESEFEVLKNKPDSNDLYIDPGFFVINGKYFSDYPLNLPKNFIVPEKIYVMYK